QEDDGTTIVLAELESRVDTVNRPFDTDVGQHYVRRCFGRQLEGPGRRRRAPIRVIAQRAQQSLQVRGHDALIFNNEHSWRARSRLTLTQGLACLTHQSDRRPT